MQLYSQSPDARSPDKNAQSLHDVIEVEEKDEEGLLIDDKENVGEIREEDEVNNEEEEIIQSSEYYQEKN